MRTFLGTLAPHTDPDDDRLIERLLACHQPRPVDPERAWAEHRPLALPAISLRPLLDRLAGPLLAAAHVLARADHPGHPGTDLLFVDELAVEDCSVDEDPDAEAA